MRTRAQEILHNQMLAADGKEVIQTAVLILDRIQGLAVKNQLLGLAAAVLALNELYGFKPQDILGTAHNILYDETNRDVKLTAAGFKKYLKDEWHLN